MARLKIILFGGIRIRTPGSLGVDFESDKVRALLAYLSVEAAQQHRREKLAALFWPDSSERRARTNLRRALTNLRQVIGDHEAEPPYLHVSRQALQFNSESDAWVDVAEFSRLARDDDTNTARIDRLRRAADLYQGDFLEGFSLPDSAAFDDWMILKGQALQTEALKTFQTLAAYYQEAGEHELALRIAARQVEIDPYWEAGQQQLIWLLAVTGQRNRALRQYEQFRLALRKELEVDPLDETVELVELLEAGEVPEPPRDVLVLEREPREVGGCPYKGLASFEEADAEFFFGRERLTTLLLPAVRSGGRPTVVIGPSGSGKSSAISAGLLPSLRGQDWTLIQSRPRGEPYRSLAEAIHQTRNISLDRPDSLPVVEELAAELRDADGTLGERLAQFIGHPHGDSRVLLVVDQLEELFTLSPNREVSETYLNGLLEVSRWQPSNGPNPYRVLLAVRVDFMSQMLAVPAYGEVLQEGAIYLAPMTRDELRAAIELPAEKQGAAFEAGLVERILDDVGENPGNLPLLEFTLTLLWQNMDQGWMTHAGYERIGRLEGAVTNYANGVYEELSAAQKTQARRALVQLIQPGSGTEDTRRVARRAELGEERWEIVRILADHRLIVTGRDESGQETAEIIHEALIWGWDRLRRWMEENRSFRLWQEDLRSAMRQWAATDHSQGALLRGAPLAQAERQLEERADRLGPDAQEFIRASLRHRDRVEDRRDRRRRRTILGLATGLAISLLLAFLAVQQWQRAERETRTATARELATSSIANLDVDPERSILLALEAIASTRDVDGTVLPQAEEALHRGIQRHRLRLTIRDPEHAKVFVTWNPTGTRVATWGDFESFPGRMKIWDAVTGSLISSHPGVFAGEQWPWEDLMASAELTPEGPRLQYWDPNSAEPITTIDFTPQGSTVGGNHNWDWSLNALMLDDGRVELWDLHSGQRVRTLGPTKEGPTGIVTFSPRGGYLAGLYESGGVRIWNHETGELLHDFAAHDANLGDLQFTPDGAGFVTAGADEVARVWDTESGQLLAELLGHSNELRTVAISADGQLAATAGWDRQIKVWDLSRSIKTGVGQEVLSLHGHPFSIWWVAFNPDASELASASLDGSIRFWDLGPEGAAEGHVYLNGPKLPSEYSADIELTSDGARLITANFAPSPKVWDSLSGELLFQLNGHAGPVQFIDLDSEDRIIATSGSDQTVRLWDAHSGRRIRTIEGIGCAGCRLAIGPQGNRLAVADPQSRLGLLVEEQPAVVRLLDLQQALAHPEARADQLLLTEVPFNPDAFYGGALGGIAFSPDGEQIAASVEGFAVGIWDAETAEPIARLSGHEAHVYGISYSPDGRLILTSSQDGTARLWDTAQGELLATLSGHTASVFHTAISPDLTTLATASFDGTVKLWDLATAEERITLDGHSAAVTDVEFSPNGSRLYTASNDGTSRTYILGLDVLIQLAESRLTRGLSDEECREYLYLQACEPR